VEKRIFRFSKDTIDWGLNENAPLTKKKLGGKGAGLVMMAQAGMPVPPGFTITTEVCNEYRKLNQPDALARVLDEWVDKLMDEVWDHDTWLGTQFGYAPLVSVRSGAPISMPGMMDTILNVGLTDERASGEGLPGPVMAITDWPGQRSYACSPVKRLLLAMLAPLPLQNPRRHQPTPLYGRGP
jgi:hypothetical protein